MSKAVKWQIPFVSTIEKTKYRIDIYAEGYSGNPIQLLGGPTPFVTEENKSDDFFTPVRSQTGNIQVCTAIPAGGTLSLDDILPANNIDHPVRLVSISGNTETIEWQGFLSCEAYSQSYTSILQILTLPVISVLEAMDSVQLSQSGSIGMKTIRTALKSAMDEMMTQSGMNFYNYVNYSGTSSRILSKYIDDTTFFESKEYDNENSVTYIISGISVKDVLSRIAAYMGWTVREQGTTIYFERIGGDVYTLQVSYSDFSNAGVIPTQVSITSANIANFEWRRADNKRNNAQGAKSVEVVAKTERYKLNMELPECPIGSLIEQYRRLWNLAGNGDWLYLLANSNINAYSNISVAYFSAVGGLTGNNWGFQNYSISSISDVLNRMVTGPNSSAEYMWKTGHNGATWCAGSFLCKYDWENTGTATAHDTANALYCTFFPLALWANSSNIGVDSDFNPSQVGSIFSINSIISFRASNGYIKLSANADTVYWYDTFDGQDIAHSNNINNEWGIALELSIGSKWWNGSSWQSTQCYFFARMTGGGFKSNWDESMPITQTDGLLIPISSSIQGIVTFKIWPMASNLASDSTTQFAHSSIMEMIFSELSIGYMPPIDSSLSNRSENHYYRLLGTNFNDEVSVNTDLASSLNNQPSPSLIMNNISGTTPMTTLDYVLSGGGTEPRRPEVDLLNRLAAYYGAARQTLELKVKHPTAAALPLLKLNGISPDTKKYLPLAESRDWIADVATLTCFETPE